MRTPDGLFFAPGVRFKQLDGANPEFIASAIEARAAHWFLEPARRICESSPFAAGLILACFIEAAARFDRMTAVEWLHEAVPASSKVDPRRSKKSIADSFEEDIRNGLAHHHRLSRGAEFSTDLDEPMNVVDSVLVVNPLLLADAVGKRWEATIAAIRSNNEENRQVMAEIRRVFRVDFEADEKWANGQTAG